MGAGSERNSCFRQRTVIGFKATVKKIIPKSEVDNSGAEPDVIRVRKCRIPTTLGSAPRPWPISDSGMINDEKIPKNRIDTVIRKVAFLGDYFLHKHQCPSRLIPCLCSLPCMSPSPAWPAKKFWLSFTPFAPYSQHIVLCYFKQKTKIITSHYGSQNVTSSMAPSHPQSICLIQKCKTSPKCNFQPFTRPIVHGKNLPWH